MVKFKAIIKIDVNSSLEAKAIVDSVKSDDMTAPKGLTVKTETKKNKEVTSIIECEKNFETFLATIDDLLSSIQVAQKSLKVI